jgi:hypothetical protein
MLMTYCLGGGTGRSEGIPEPIDHSGLRVRGSPAGGPFKTLPGTNI